MKYDVIVIGGGAAGLFCAAEAGKRGRRVLVIEHSVKPGKKILISGGGRCNFTNLGVTSANFLSHNPHFAKSALARYTSGDFISLVRKHKISYHEKTLGQLFCDNSASQILSMLIDECRAGSVTLITDCRVSEIKRDTRFLVETSQGVFDSETLVIASGGLSIPKIGATDFGYRVARQFGLKIETPYAALVPFTFTKELRARWCDLTGLSTEVIASCDGQSFREKMLVTHRGLSGPAILQISSYWRPGRAVRIDLLPGGTLAEVPASDLRRELLARLPSRFAERWLENEGFTQPALSPRRLEERIHRWEVVPAGTEGFDKAEVTGGGVSTGELSSKTMEARNVPGLFFVGEVVDVTGHLGGYNFQWAWSSAHAAACAMTNAV